ncbi:MAG: Rieske 2Fe-2S domain-containing protein [Gemmatimonadetes bacterium]|nr:Rieske 2Fe-2S domain-containing protein [Gemmatimonadota bacterium]
MPVNWNRQKRLYDLWVSLGTLALVAGYAVATLVVHPTATVETALIRGLGFAAFLLLTVILMVGPASRLDRRFLPLLYNRRHLGVTVGLLGLAHAAFVLFQYHALGNTDPIASLLAIPSTHDGIPFEWYGIGAGVVLFLMAATSHDYWLSVLTPPGWKALHMAVYPAYLALLLHVGLGLGRAEPAPVYLATAGLAAVLVAAIHLVAALRERRADQPGGSGPDWVDVGPADRIPEGRAITRVVAGERVAVFRHQGRVSAVSGVCKHQNGPLGEGKIVDGCITCPWHGYQYRPEDGTSPPPFTDSVPTFNLAVRAGRILVDPVPNQPGTRVDPVPVTPPAAVESAPFYVGYLPPPTGLVRFLRAVPAVLLLPLLGLMVTFAAAQRSFDRAVFEYGTERTIQGTVRTAPYPMLEVERPGTATVSRYLLAGFGKRGAQEATVGLDGKKARIVGTLAYRDNLTVLEIAGAEPLGPGRPAPAPRSVSGRLDLVGEIVDGKCYAGVMNPGRGATHRGCAIRCLAGGLTPLFVIQNQDGTLVEMILTDDAGHSLPQAARWAGRPVQVSGRIESLDDIWFLRVDPATIRSAHD